ncbi:MULTISPECIES: ABC transporter permease [unclassified Mesorhizobium]|uniref:ABC transporter permease n=1 Tax=unclassified Mesorhizobium TaxID=325217 RepID=UPI000FC9DD45|nr:MULTISPECIES: ABC transporter permease [unclassified Mesorhizobium]RUV54573.1 ABC transporter permease [Mesorhizobium sp. M5C.F.Ca.IN.020.29.1.1]RWK49948.1 MAG: ABC transporter permease [Mesorhizobium sp.]TIM85475.1 MAG: ABC transporter permease subunit [Mesorhizobium sp.]TIP41486.1 MAG: ABC transporter permease subunit [Mesorhizobium sp.]
MYPLIRTILQRLGLGLITLVVVSLIIFSAVEFLPGDFAKSILGQSATPETVAAFQKEIGLDKPASMRYLEWIGGVIHGDFGLSFASRAGVQRSVAEIIGPRLRNTLFLGGITAVIAVPLALLLGVLAALYRDSWFDRAINAATLTAISFPEFFVAYILMLFLAVKFPIFHSLANIDAEMGLFESLKRVVLPVLTLTLVIVAHMMRMTRSALIGLLGSPYVEMAQLKGVSPAHIILGHVLPNAWAPIANVIAFNLAYLVVGIVVVEVVFVYPGIGQATVDAVRSRDIPVVQASALIFASTYILLNLMADIIAIATNPRLLHPK